jgi:exopolysaccharide production repressor protein
MSLPRFILGLLATLLVFAAGTYFLTGSVWQTIFGTLLCALVIQVGYFLIVLFLVLRTPKQGEGARQNEAETSVSRRGKLGTAEPLRRSRNP